MTKSELTDMALDELLVDAQSDGELDGVLDVLSQMTEPEMSGTTVKELAELSRSTSKWVRAAAALSPRLPSGVLGLLKQDPEPIVREAAARFFRN